MLSRMQIRTKHAQLLTMSGCSYIGVENRQNIWAKHEKGGIGIDYYCGDIFSPNRTGHELIICHQINCQGIMGAGLAKQIHAMFPQVYEMYQRNCTQAANRQDLLGKVLFCPIQYNRCENKFKGIWQNGNLIYIFKCLNTVFALIMSGIIFFNNYVLCILRNI